MGHFTQVSGSCWNTFEALESSTGGRGRFPGHQLHWDIHMSCNSWAGRSARRIFSFLPEKSTRNVMSFLLIVVDRNGQIHK